MDSSQIEEQLKQINARLSYIESKFNITPHYYAVKPPQEKPTTQQPEKPQAVLEHSFNKVG